MHCIDAGTELQQELDATEIKRIRQQIFLPLRYGLEVVDLLHLSLLLKQHLLVQYHYQQTGLEK